MQDLALRTLEMAAAGLKGRASIDPQGVDETHFLAPLRQIAETGKTPAEELLELYNWPWHGSVDPVFKEFAY